MLLAPAHQPRSKGQKTSTRGPKYKQEFVLSAKHGKGRACRQLLALSLTVAASMIASIAQWQARDQDQKLRLREASKLSGQSTAHMTYASKTNSIHRSSKTARTQA